VWSWEPALPFLNRNAPDLPTTCCSDHGFTCQLGIQRMSSVSINGCKLTPELTVSTRDNTASAENNAVGISTFPYMAYNNASNDATTCITLCQQFGYNAAGLEYGSQCCKDFIIQRFVFAVAGLIYLQSAVTLKTFMLLQLRELQRIRMMSSFLPTPTHHRL
jgi:hypothetical protein